MGLVFLYDNVADRIVATYTSQAAGFAGTNLFDGNRHTYWKATSTADQYVTFDAGVGKTATCDYVALARADLLVTAAATVVVQYSTDNFGADINNAFTPVALNSGLLFQLASEDWWAAFTTQTKRYWRLKLSGLTSAPQFAGLWIGTQKTITETLNEPAEFSAVRALRGGELAGDITLVTEATAQILADYIAAVTPGFPLEQPIETLSGAIYGATPHWIYDSAGVHFRKTGTAVLLNVQLLNPAAMVNVNSFARHGIGGLRWRQLR
jgi:hypothetical protein